jgi:hypothetical protein
MVKSSKQIFEFNRNYIAELAVKGASIKNCGKMCSSCAFKKDSEANLERHNVEAAIQSLEMGQFNCHIETDVDSGTPCKGFLNALQVIDPDRKVRHYQPKNVSECPYCQKKFGDKNDEILNRCNKNKSGMTKRKCECGNRFYATYNYMGGLETFKL